MELDTNNHSVFLLNYHLVLVIKKEFLSIKTKLWKEYFWSKSYCLITTGGAPIDIVRKYIENQGLK
ncbi:transposase [Clostridium estertheticum]|uniref:Transposase n=2 Tax=Clostridium TaxID=1485 RepID=A0AA47ELT9_9CLOT|nr:MULTISPECIES: transposase [Clostridium]MBU3101940.1 transposase [Clostridium sp. DSM 17811]MBU3156912.1 transposase [Clostridium estertheticum]MBU3201610.1 transposase [Clostridium estertheticum]WAG62608.1 transposase [Clostridium estertheticum]WAG67890.1 transposase [Clostridium estertheticum]